MANCCDVSQTRPEHSNANPFCPACGIEGKKVECLTLRHLAIERPNADVREARYYFCESAGCEVVYFSNETGQRFDKSDVTVRVGLKETKDPIPICYCFGHTVASAREEIVRTGASTVVERITAEIKAGNCACEVRNPSGRCCLGEVSKAVNALVNRGPALVAGGTVSGSISRDSSLGLIYDCCAVKQ